MKRNKHKIIYVIIGAAVLAALMSGCGNTVKNAGLKSADAGETGEAPGEPSETGKGAEDDPMAEVADLMQEYEAMEEADAGELSETLNAAGPEDVSDSGDDTDSAQAAPGDDTDTDDDTDSISIIMVGDILLHKPVEEAAYDEETGKYNYDFIFANTADDIKAADIAIVNEEVIIGGEELGVSGYPSFNAPYEVADALVENGFDVICHATNHALDKGAKGIRNCTAYWNEKYPDIKMVGIHESAEDAEDMCILDEDGIRIAVLNYTYGTNGISLPGDMPFAVDELDGEKVIADLERAEEEADFTIVIPHWGKEYSMSVTEDQKKWALLMAEYGADLIIGAHPHVIEPVEWIETEGKGPGEGGRALCYYSLGNFVNWTSGIGKGVVNRMIGGMAKVSLSKDEQGVYISHYGIEPLVCHVESGRENVRVYKLSDYSDELGERNEIQSQDPEFSYGYCMAMTEEMWGEIMQGVDVAR